MSSDFDFTVASWFLGNVHIKPISTHSDYFQNVLKNCDFLTNKEALFLFYLGENTHLEMLHVLIFLFSRLHFSATRVSLVNHNRFHKTFQYLLSSLFCRVAGHFTPWFFNPVFVLLSILFWFYQCKIESLRRSG